MTLYFVNGNQTGTANDDILLGLSQAPHENTLEGGNGDDLIIGDFTTEYFSLTSRQTLFGNSSTDRLNLSLASPFWQTGENVFVENSETVPYTQIFEEVTTAPRELWYSVQTASANQTLTLDIDFGDGPLGGDADLVIEVYDSTGTTVWATVDNAISGAETSIGSTSLDDPFGSMNLAAAGEYLIRVAERDAGTGNIVPIQTGTSFLLNVSLTGQFATGTTLSGNDSINGGTGNDTLLGMGGNDTINGTIGSDLIYGGDGDDSLIAGGGNDVLYGGIGNDQLAGDSDPGSDLIYGGDGDDLVFMGVALFTGEDNYFGGDGNDTINGNASYTNLFVFDLLNGEYRFNGQLAGRIDSFEHYDNRTFTGSEGVIGTFGDNNIATGGGGNSISGLAGNDSISAGGWQDLVFGGDGNDLIYGGDGNDSLFDGEGRDVIFGGDGNDYIQVEQFAGAADADTVFAGDGNDTVRRGDANANEDAYFGGAGNDTLLADTSFNSLVAVDLGNDQIRLNGAFFETVDGFEHYSNAGGTTAFSAEDVFGTSGANNIATGGGDNSILGLAGNDSISAGAGNDTVDGGADNDLIYGGLNDDSIAAGSGEDTVFGGDGNDSIDGDGFNDLIYGGLNDDSIAAGSGNDTVFGGDGNDSIDGEAGADLIYGGAGNDTLKATSIRPSDPFAIYGGDDDDVIIFTGLFPATPEIYGGNGSDTLDTTTFEFSSGSHFDLLNNQLSVNGILALTWDGLESFINDSTSSSTGFRVTGTNDDNYIRTSAGDNSISTLAGNDTIISAAGADSIDAGAGIDLIYGGDDADTINAGADVDIVYGGDGDDRIIDGVLDGDTYFGGAGNDWIDFNGGSFTFGTVDLTAGNVSLFVGPPVNQTLVFETWNGFEHYDNSTSTNDARKIIGTTGANSILAGGGGNTITTLGGDDYIDAGSGNDNIDAGAGNDTVIGGDGADSMDGGAGTHDLIDYSGSSAPVIVNLLTGVASGGDAQGDTVLNFENIIGTAGNDTLIGNSSPNTIEGGAGADSLAGDDPASGDTLSYASSSAGVTVNLQTNSVFGGHATGDVISGFENIIGSDHNDTLTAADGLDSLTIFGGDGDDILDGGVGGKFKLFGGDGNDIAFSDLITAGQGADGGSGIDTIYRNDTGDQFVEVDLSGGRISRDSFAVVEHWTNFENYIEIANQSGADLVTGTAGANEIVTGYGDNTISAFSGNDSVDAGEGNDSIDGHAGDDLIYGGWGNDTIDGGLNNDLIYGGLLNDSIDGGTGADIIYGGWWNDTIEGGGGVDIIYGGEDDDLIVGDNSGGPLGIDTVFAGDGNDTVQRGARADYYGGAGIDILDTRHGSAFGPHQHFDFSSGQIIHSVVGGTTIGYTEVLDGFENYIGRDNSDEVVTGNDGINIITTGNGDNSINGLNGNDTINAGGGNDTIDGGAGADSIDAGAGNDTVIGGAGADSMDGGAGTHDLIDYSASAAPVIVNLLTGVASGGDAQGDTVLNFENIIGTAGNDTLIGNSSPNTIEGGAGADSLAGDDPAFLDTLSYASSSAGVTVNLQTNSVFGGHATGDVISGFENIIGSDHNDTLTAYGPASSTIFGGDGDDILDGGTTLFGGDGNDIAFSDVITGGNGADGGSGIDTIYRNDTGELFVEVDLWRGTIIYSDVFTVAEHWTNFENYIEIANQSGAVSVTGTDGANEIVTGFGNNTIWADSGNDSIDAGAGDDDVNGGLGDDLIYAGDGNDLVFGGEQNDSLFGEAGNDTIYDELGSDVIYGGDDDDHIIVNLAGGSLNRDTAFGGDGDDIIRRGGLSTAGEDAYFGGAGNDTIELNGQVFTVFAHFDLSANQLTGPSGFIETWDSFEHFVNDSGNGNERVTGTNGANTITTAGGVNSISGLDGADIIDPGAGNDTVDAGDGADLIFLQDGGNDSVAGGDGNDGLFFGAEFDQFDIVDGGAGDGDQLALQGDYSAGLSLGANSTKGIEQIVFLPGNLSIFGVPAPGFSSFDVMLEEGAIGAGEQMFFQANQLQSMEAFTLNASNETDGSIFTFGGLGIENITGSQNDDAFFFGTQRFATGDRVNGGGGMFDAVGLQGDYAAPLFIDSDQLISVEVLALLSSTDARFGASSGSLFSYNLIMDDGNVAAGGSMIISANALIEGEILSFDGSAEIDGFFLIFSGNGDDVISGSQGADTISGRGGVDTLTGNAGDDAFFYTNATDSTPTDVDRIMDFTQGDTINLEGIDANIGAADDQAFAFIGNAAFSSVAGQLRAVNTSGNVWTVQADNDGDGAADLQIEVTTSDGDAITAADFVL